jgi:prepilin-type N-terminal cleavage/methylation domain-containing protein
MYKKAGFTLIELLIVIGVIAILAAAVIIAINPGRQFAEARNRTRENHANSLSNALLSYQISNQGSFPEEIDKLLLEICNTANEEEGEHTVDCSSKVDLSVLVPNYINAIPQDPRKSSTDTGTGYYIAKDHLHTNITVVQGLKEISCEEGWIGVPGNPMYGTSDFCIMKYEAKNIGGVATSQPEETPWVSISWTNSKSECQDIEARLINNNEWMTIARNIEAQPQNWTTLTVGSGHLFRGHTDNNPSNALAASADDGEGYYGTGNTSPSEQRRTHVLSNGEIIWDFSGNVWNWVEELVEDPCNQPGEACLLDSNTGAWTQWTSVTNYGKYNYDQLRASDPSWSGSNSIGQLYRYNATNRVFRRGGRWSNGSNAGAFSLSLSGSPTFTSTVRGFRCSR